MKTTTCLVCRKRITLAKDYHYKVSIHNTPLLQGGSPPPKEGKTVYTHTNCLEEVFDVFGAYKNKKETKKKVLEFIKKLNKRKKVKNL